MRCTEETLIPTAATIAAPVQCVASPGGSPCVRVMTRSAICGASGGRREGRVLSRNSPSPGGHEPLLPAPHTGFALAGAAHDLDRAETIGSQQYDPPARHAFAGCSGRTLRLRGEPDR